MALYFLDSSAIVKRHVMEPGQAWVNALCDPAARHTIAIAEISIVEVIASFCRMAREVPQRLSMPDRDRLILIFEKLASSEYTVVVINRTLLSRAAALCRLHPLRAYDAVQLACALTQRDTGLSASRLAPIFVSADTVLLSAAQAEGFVIENPNAYP